MKVIKRDNTEQEFSASRIVEAVYKAALSSGETDEDSIQIATDTATLVSLRLVGKGSQLTVGYIQDIVEDTLMDSTWKVVAKAYIEYRHDRDRSRELNEGLFKDVLGLVELTDKEALDENANKASQVFSTQRDLIAGAVAKHYAKKFLLPKEIMKAHEDGKIHFHDLDYFPLQGLTNCCLVDLKGMLEEGFAIGNARIESPRSIQTAATVVSQIATAVASSQYGGTSFDRLDEVLAPYVTLSYLKEKERVEKEAHELGVYPEPTIVDKLALKSTEKIVFDACQTMEYQVNSMTTTNGQTPFLTFGFGLGESWEAKLIQKGILQNRINGLGKNKTTAVFPKLIYGIKEGLNRKEGDLNYDVKKLALECAANRMYPDILNYDQIVEVTGGYKASMGCRSFLSYKEDENGNEFYSGRNNLGVVTINPVKAALESGGDVDEFWKILEDYTEICHKSLQFRLKELAKVKAKSAPILYMEGALLRLQPEEYVLPHLLERGASISLGYIGLEETANAMMGNEVHTYDSKEKQDFILSVLKFFDSKVKEWKQAEGVGYSCYGTPSESLCNRFNKILTSQFGILEGVTDKGYLTNSFHLDVLKKVNPYDKIDFEAKFIPHSSGGFIGYGEYPNMKMNVEALENVWDYSYSRTPYYGTNTPIDECFECGYSGEFECTSRGFRCPKCGNNDSDKCSVTRRTCGYLGNPEARPFNEGKQKEIMNRTKHM